MERDLKKAVQLYSAAAAAGSVAAMFNLAVSYEDGVGVDDPEEKRVEKARYWMERAASKGDRNALEALKDMPRADATTTTTAATTTTATPVAAA